VANILIVDDEKSICELLEITFRKDGHRVEIAASGELGRRRIESKLFDIIISDIRMPDMSGVDLLAYAKEVAPSTVFLLITGVPTVETAIAAINAALDIHLAVTTLFDAPSVKSLSQQLGTPASSQDGKVKG